MKLPPKVHRKHGALHYVHRNKWRRLCDEDASPAELYRALAEVTKPPGPTTVNALLDRYIIDKLPEKRPSTIRSYEGRIPRLRRAFGHMTIADVEPTHVAQFLEKRRAQGAGVSGNREMAILSAAFTHGMRNGWARANPCRGVSRNTERPRKRFVSDEEFADALVRAAPPFRLFLAFAELTGLRQSDIRALTWAQVTPAGIAVQESKTGKRLLIEWSGALAGVVAETFYANQWDRRGRDRVFLNGWRRPWTVWGVQSAMRRLQVGWALHDVRARAESIHPVGLGLLARYKRARRVTPVR